jgi:hypothetical protein
LLVVIPEQETLQKLSFLESTLPNAYYFDIQNLWQSGLHKASIMLKPYLFTRYEVQASLSIQLNEKALEAWTPNHIDRFRTASYSYVSINSVVREPLFQENDFLDGLLFSSGHFYIIYT